MPKLNRTIKYSSKDFDSLKLDLQNYAKNYFPNAQKDFSDASTGEMLIELMSYVGDVLSFYQEEQFREIFTDTATDVDSILALSSMLGYKPKGATNSVAKLKLQAIIPPLTTGSIIDHSLQPIIAKGSTFFTNNDVNTIFELTDDVNFAVSSSFNPISSSIQSVDGNGDVINYLVTAYGFANSGDIKITEKIIGPVQEFMNLTIVDDNIVGIDSVVDSEGNTWYEVDYLAQDKIEIESNNDLSVGSFNAINNIEVPKILNYIEDDRRYRRFTTYYDSNANLHLQFGPGLYRRADEDTLQDISYLGIPDSLLSTDVQSLDPRSFLRTRTMGESPGNTTLTIRYRTSNAEIDNVIPNSITRIGEINIKFPDESTNTSLSGQLVINSLVVTNDDNAVGGYGFESLEEIKQNSKANFASQLRCVTQADIEVRAKAMAGKYGLVAKSYAIKRNIIGNETPKEDELPPTSRGGRIVRETIGGVGNVIGGNISLGLSQLKQTSDIDLSTSNGNINLYILTKDIDNNLASTPLTLKYNLRNYLSRFKMMTDQLNIIDALIINFGISFSISVLSGFNGQQVLFNCIEELKSYFHIDRMQINQPINLGEVKYRLYRIDGVQNVNRFNFKSLSGGNYSNFSYSTLNSPRGDVIVPAKKISCFELKFPETDIIGVVQ